jgi:tRNA-dihydrouridine synthase A
VSNPLHFPYAVAPMIAVTNHYCRYFMRLLSKHVVLYTEMVTAQAILHGPWEQLLYYHPAEHPVVLQLGGADPALLASCARKAEQLGFDAINLNVGCPSERVYAGQFGLCLLKSPQLVADCVKAMQDAASIPVTVKTRTGVDEYDDYAFLSEFVSTLVDAGLSELILHARKGWLKGLSPKENRTIPPLTYDTVYRIKQDFPNLRVCLNGGVKTLAEGDAHLQHVDQIMMGRAMDDQPYMLAELDQRYKEGGSLISRKACLESYCAYLSSLPDFHVSHALRPLMGLFHGQPLARAYRKALSDLIIQQNELSRLDIVKNIEKMITVLS